MDLGSKQTIVDPALPAQASAARVIRSCSRFCPPLSIVPNPAADPGADAIHATTTRNAASLQRRRRTSRTSLPSPPRTGYTADRRGEGSPGGVSRGGDAVRRRLGLLTQELDHPEHEDEPECDDENVAAGRLIEEDEHEHGKPDGGPT